MKKDKFTKYTLTQRYGMESVGDMYYEYMSPEDIEKDRIKHSSYIEDCKLKGIYGKEYTISLNIQHDPMYDSPMKNNNGSVSYRMTFLDL
jgi:hypothetical protein